MTTAPDPMPAATLGMWLFVAAEGMFFAGLLSAFLVLQSTPGEHALFVRSAAVVSRPLTAVAVGLLVASSAVLWRGGRRWVVAGLAVAFLAVQASAGHRLLSHHTIVTATAVYDGRATTAAAEWRVTGVRLPLPPTFDLARAMPSDLPGVAGTYAIPTTDVRAAAAYGSSRNNYFGCYFLVTAAHAAQVVGGLVALGWLAVRRRSPAAAAAVTLYWQFANGVGAVSLVLLALG